MITATNRALAVVRRMPLDEREEIRDMFDRSIPSTDSVWLECWGVPATEIDVALRLLQERGY